MNDTINLDYTLLLMVVIIVVVAIPDKNDCKNAGQIAKGVIALLILCLGYFLWTYYQRG